MSLFQIIQHFLFADIIGAGVQIFFIVTIIMMIFDAQKPPLKTSIPTGIALIVLGVSHSYGADITRVLSMVGGCLWLYLAYQRYNQK